MDVGYLSDYLKGLAYDVNIASIVPSVYLEPGGFMNTIDELIFSVFFGQDWLFIIPDKNKDFPELRCINKDKSRETLSLCINYIKDVDLLTMGDFAIFRIDFVTNDGTHKIFRLYSNRPGIEIL